VVFNWRTEHQEAFEKVKRRVVEAIELYAINPEKDFQLQTDASNVGIGAVLLKQIEVKWRPVAVASRKLNVHEKLHSY
jgi:hypothetical protein